MRRMLKYLFWMAIGAWAWQQGSRQPAPAAGQRREKADNPAELSSTGWKTTLKLTKQALKDKNLSLTAAALGYYATLSFFPVALGCAALYASVVSPAALRSAIDGLQGIVPAAVYQLIDTQLSPLARASQSSTIVATILSVVALLWTTSGGLQNLIKATNITYDAKETRTFIKLRATSLLLSVGLLLFGALAVVLLVLKGSALESWGWPHLIAALFPYLRWLLLLLLVTVGLALVYRYAPNRPEPRWQWVSWGAAAASLIWLLGTLAFFIYAQNFANFNKTYGIFAGLVVLMTWFNLSGLIVLVGAQVNKKLEDATTAPTVDE